MRMTILVFAAVLTCVSCGDTVRSGDTANPAGRTMQETTPSFSTRLNDQLMISGVNCDGTESTTYGGVTYNCADDEWLISIDNINNCNGGGACGEPVIPIVASLSETAESTDPEQTYTQIVPSSPVTADQEASINSVWVSFSLRGTAEVIRRN